MPSDLLSTLDISLEAFLKLAIRCCEKTYALALVAKRPGSSPFRRSLGIV